MLRGAERAAVRRHEGRAEGPPGDGRRRRSRPARCSSRRASACASAPAGRCRRPRSCTKASTSARKGQVALITYMRTDSTRVSNDALTAVRGHISTRLTASRYLPDEAERLRVGQERPGSPRGDPADRPDDDAAAGRSRWPRRRSAAAVHADLQPLRRQPDDAGRLRRHQRRDRRPGRGLFQGHGPDRASSTATARCCRRPASRRTSTLPPLDEKQTARPARPVRQRSTSPSRRRATTRRRWSRRWRRKASAGRAPTRPSSARSRSAATSSRSDRRFFATEIGKIVTDLLVQALPEGHGPEVHQPHRGGTRRDRDAARCKYADVLNEFWGPFSRGAEAGRRGACRSQRARETGEKCPKCGKPLVEQFSTKTRASSSAAPAGGTRRARASTSSRARARRTEPTDGEVPHVRQADAPAGEPLGPVPRVQRVRRTGRCKTTRTSGRRREAGATRRQTDYQCPKCGNEPW